MRVVNQVHLGDGLSTPSNDDMLLLADSALRGLEAIWRHAHRYSKAEILLMDLRNRGELTGDLYTPCHSERSDGLMKELDRINLKFGRSAIHSARMPVHAAWAMKRELMSRRYTRNFH